MASTAGSPPEPGTDSLRCRPRYSRLLKGRAGRDDERNGTADRSSRAGDGRDRRQRGWPSARHCPTAAPSAGQGPLSPSQLGDESPSQHQHSHRRGRVGNCLPASPGLSRSCRRRHRRQTAQRPGHDATFPQSWGVAGCGIRAGTRTETATAPLDDQYPLFNKIHWNWNQKQPWPPDKDDSPPGTTILIHRTRVRAILRRR